MNFNMSSGVQTRSKTRMLLAQSRLSLPYMREIGIQTDPIKEVNTTNLTYMNMTSDKYTYKDKTYGVVFLTRKQYENLNITYPYAIIMTEIEPSYRENLPEHLKSKELFALAPEGQRWKELDRGTSYFHWDEWYGLVKN